VPAYVVLGYWFLLQVLGGLPQLGGTSAGVAFWAHVGGFVAGLSIALAAGSRRATTEPRRAWQDEPRLRLR
jgi:membrane associated rhomboid family serine protease